MNATIPILKNQEMERNPRQVHPLDPARLGLLKYPEAEAAFSLEVDRIRAMSHHDPLNGLCQIIQLMQGINLELLKAQAPALLENAHRKADEFAANGKIVEDKKEGVKALNSFVRIQDATVKLGVAQVKVNDELQRRDQTRGGKQADGYASGQHRVPDVLEDGAAGGGHGAIGAGGQGADVNGLPGPAGEWTVPPKSEGDSLSCTSSAESSAPTHFTLRQTVA
jgi:hypothetical protein